MTAKPTNFYADFHGMAALRKDAKAKDPSALEMAAKQFESLFTQMMLKGMRSTTFGDPMFDSSETKFYQDMFDSQLAVKMSETGGMGLADMLIKQLSSTGQAPTVEGATDKPQGLTMPTPAATTSGVAVDERQKFIAALQPHAERAGRELGVDPQALLAQAALETGWGRSLPRDAQGNASFNLFGIKATRHWEGGSVTASTQEFEQGIPVSRHEQFRAYDSAAASFEDYVATLKNNPRYAAALGTGGDVAAFASALQKGGYATDPQYAAKLVAVAGSLKNYQL
jgi:flagellar protein FlgJ